MELMASAETGKELRIVIEGPDFDTGPDPPPPP